MWAPALGWAAGWKCLLSVPLPSLHILPPFPSLSFPPVPAAHDPSLQSSSFLRFPLLSPLSLPSFISSRSPALPSLESFPSLRSLPLTAFHSWHSIFCFPFPHLPFFPSLPFLSFHFLPVLPFPSRPFPCLSPTLLPCLPFSPVPSSCSLLSERTHQMGYSTWNSLCATLPPVCFRVAGIGTFIPHLPPEFNIEKRFSQ